MQEERKTQVKSKAKYNGKLVADYPPEEQKAIRVKAGKNCVKSKANRRAAKDVLLDILHSDSTNKELADLAARKGVEPSEMATLLLAMTQRAGRSAQMAELVFRLTGDLQETPQQNITIVNQLTDEQLLAERNRILNSGDSCINITPEPPKLEE
jgi:hypothetical protein